MTNIEISKLRTAGVNPFVELMIVRLEALDRDIANAQRVRNQYVYDRLRAARPAAVAALAEAVAFQNAAK